MSWLNANDYMTLAVAARDRAEELHETSELVHACARRDDDQGDRASVPPQERARSARPSGSCWILRRAAAGL